MSDQDSIFTREPQAGDPPTPDDRPEDRAGADSQPGRLPAPDEQQDAQPEPPAVATAGGGAPAGAVPRALGYLAAAVGGGLLVGLALVAVGVLGGGGAPGSSPVPSATTAASSQPPGQAFVDGQAVGWADAPVTVTIWADYQCPFCKLEAFAFGGSLERQYAGSGLARIVFRDFAFLGQESLDAAVAARCASRQDPAGYWRYHDLLFLQQQGENQGAFVRSNLVGLAEIAGLDSAAFTACLDDPVVLGAVKAEAMEGRAQGVQSTPTTIITGPGPTQVLRGFTRDWAALSAAVERAADPAATPTPSPAPTPLPSPTASTTPAASSAPSGSSSPEASPAASPEASPTASP